MISYIYKNIIWKDYHLLFIKVWTEIIQRYLKLSIKSNLKSITLCTKGLLLFSKVYNTSRRFEFICKMFTYFFCNVRYVHIAMLATFIYGFIAAWTTTESLFDLAGIVRICKLCIHLVYITVLRYPIRTRT